MPQPEIDVGGSLTVLWWVFSGVCLLAGLGMLVASNTTRFKSTKL